MSSVFLYVAIVAIWAFVLVPRWLRRHHSQPGNLTEANVTAEAPLEGYDGAADHGGAEWPTDEDKPVAPAASADRPATAAHLTPSHSRMMQARRRLLTTLVLIAATAGAAAAIRLIPWWVFAPPAGVLVCYFIMLRTAARADADYARRTAASHARQARIQAARHCAAVSRACAPDAQIIDISSRVGDQLYDQYADATVRASGD